MIGRIVLAGWCALLLVAIGGVLGFFFYAHFLLGLSLDRQTGTIRLPSTLDVRARATRDVAIGLKGRIDARVPFKQTLQVPLHGAYTANLVLDATMPLRFRIHYQGKVPIHARTEVEGTTDLVFHNSLLPKFPLKLMVPLDFEQPVNLVVPVDTQFRLQYRGPVTITFHQNLSVPVDTVLRTHLDVDRTVETPIVSTFDMALQVPSVPRSVVVDHADLRLPLSTLRLQHAAD